MARNVALSLGLEEQHFDSVLTHPGCSALVAHYPPQEAGSGNLGLSAHTDAEYRSLSPFYPLNISKWLADIK